MASKTVSFGKLKGRMAEVGITQNALAKSLGMSRSSLSLKMNGKREFTLAELRIIVEVLNIDDPRSYFFA